MAEPANVEPEDKQRLNMTPPAASAMHPNVSQAGSTDNDNERKFLCPAHVGEAGSCRIQCSSIGAAYGHEKGCQQLLAILDKEVPIQEISEKEWTQQAEKAAVNGKWIEKEWFVRRVQANRWLTGSDMTRVAEAHNRCNLEDSFVISGQTIVTIKNIMAGSLERGKVGFMSERRQKNLLDFIKNNINIDNFLTKTKLFIPIAVKLDDGTIDRDTNHWVLVEVNLHHPAFVVLDSLQKRNRSDVKVRQQVWHIFENQLGIEHSSKNWKKG